MTESIRLSKHLARMLPCSRREAEQYIEGGWVLVDGQVVEEPQFPITQQTVELSAGAVLAPTQPVTLLFNKPAGYGIEKGPQSASQLLTPATLAAEDRSGYRLLKRHFAQLTILPALAIEDSGLLVLTQDWRIVRKLTDDYAKLEQEYILEVVGSLTPEQLEALNGAPGSGASQSHLKVSWQNETHLRIALKSARPGQLKSVCEGVGLRVLNIRRIRIGRLPMARLPQGQWRYLLPHERF